MQDNTVHLLAGQKKLNNDYKDLDELPKLNKADMAGKMIKE